ADPEDLLQSRRRILVPRPQEEAGVLQELDVLLVRLLGELAYVEYECVVAPDPNETRDRPLAHADRVRAIDVFGLHLRAALALPLPLAYDPRFAARDDVARHRRRERPHDRARHTLQARLLRDVADARSLNDLRIDRAANSRADRIAEL